MTNEKRDKLNEAILLCKIHNERMSFAWEGFMGRCYRKGFILIEIL